MNGNPAIRLIQRIGICISGRTICLGANTGIIYEIGEGIDWNLRAVVGEIQGTLEYQVLGGEMGEIVRRKVAEPLTPRSWSISFTVIDSPPAGQAYLDEESIQLAVLKTELPPGIDLKFLNTRLVVVNPEANAYVAS